MERRLRLPGQIAPCQSCRAHIGEDEPILPDWADLTQAERDAAYNNMAAVTNARALQDARHQASAGFRARHAAHLDIPYASGERSKWDIFPGSDPTAPCLVFIHGGYWQRGGRGSASVVARGVMAHGWSAAFVGYPLAPAASMTEIIRHLHLALDWLGAEGRAFGVRGPVVVAGSSAGGHLTAMALSHPLVRAGLAISGIYDLGPIRDTFLNAKLGLTEEEIAAFSPQRLAPVPKPLTIAYGSCELPALVKNAQDLHARRAAGRQPGALVAVPGANHFSILDQFEEPGGILTREALALAG
jgi:acetyl esterase/lipase